MKEEIMSSLTKLINDQRDQYNEDMNTLFEEQFHQDLNAKLNDTLEYVFFDSLECVVVSKLNT